MTGAQSWQQSGKEEHAAGEAEYDAAQAKNWAEGAADRVEGKKDSVVGAVFGDKSQQVQGELSFEPLDVGQCADRRLGNLKHDKGEAQQDANSFTK